MKTHKHCKPSVVNISPTALHQLSQTSLVNPTFDSSESSRNKGAERRRARAVSCSFIFRFGKTATIPILGGFGPMEVIYVRSVTNNPRRARM